MIVTLIAVTAGLLTSMAVAGIRERRANRLPKCYLTDDQMQLVGHLTADDIRWTAEQTRSTR